MAGSELWALIEERLSRRAALRRLAGLAALPVVASRGVVAPLAAFAGASTAARSPSSLAFAEIPHGSDGGMHVPPGYRAEVLLAWGDPLFEGAPRFDPRAQTAAAQARQFGANADWIAYVPLPPDGERGGGPSARGLLCVNHEAIAAHMSFPGFARKGARDRATRDTVAVEMEALGVSIVEVEKQDGRWRAVRGKRNRRITGSTPVRLSGPCAGHERLRTRADATGKLVVGTLNNCAGGVTPWGTILTCEENFDWHFAGKTEDTRERENHRRYRVGRELAYAWHRFHERFDVAREPREANRFGWVVELDARDPASVPVKRTALGRFKHESATCVVSSDGRVAVYSGDDEEFEHVYRFVTARAFDPEQPEASRDLLDEGVLSAARFDAGGTLTWLPLVHGTGPLTPENGFASQADVLIETRRAATLVGATRMDRPEGIDADREDGRVYVVLTKNGSRGEKDVDAANPRAKNRHGHVLELVPPRAANGRPDHAAPVQRWDIFLMGGDPRDPASGALYHADVGPHGWLSCPDNATLDPRGRLWIATDGSPTASGFADGVWACDTRGEGRALTRHFFTGPRGCEVCGPCFTPDGRTLFLSVQHPGDADDRGRSGDACCDSPTARFPDEDEKMPPRAAVIAIVREDGGEIGT